jgi:hypothetical protein
LAACAAPVLLVLMVQIITRLHRGDVGLDLVAALSMTAALIFGEQLAAALVALMYAGGQYLESFAERHARREMTGGAGPRGHRRCGHSQRAAGAAGLNAPGRGLAIDGAISPLFPVRPFPVRR